MRPPDVGTKSMAAIRGGGRVSGRRRRKYRAAAPLTTPTASDASAIANFVWIAPASDWEQ
jgi:hypothetical protein